jgi:hypothetical protein
VAFGWFGDVNWAECIRDVHKTNYPETFRCLHQNTGITNRIAIIIIIIIIIIIEVKLDTKQWYDYVPKSDDQAMKVRLPYYGTNKCEPTELFLSINRTTLQFLQTEM